ncbi:MAG: DNA polymerase III subunit gamma/tau [Psychrobacter sp.]|nr:DNA polymerase III subunit gamma/tau [Psychrobacter sp.]
MTQQYQVLARKYRPKNFHELIGQTHVSQALINAIDYNRLHHAYLFTGTRGVGKTTIARILAKCLNCDLGVTSTPCGVCDNCVAIDQGRFIDLIEIDAASRTKVEDTRELLDNVPYAPSQGRYKVYLIDEVHMLSTHSFNALLKTLEEPPEHVKFLLATTDPQKLPITIISRCLQFVLRPLAQTLLSEHLANILTQEQVDYTQPALWQLASAAKGSVRDALSLTDQAIAFGQGALDDATVNAMLGLIDAADLVRLITDIYNHDKSAVAAHIEQMRAQMVDASSMFDGLAELLHQLALTQLLPEVALNVNEAQAETIMTLAQHISPDVLQLYYEIVVQAREGIKLASTPMQALEMCILRLLAFRPLPVNEIIAPSFNDSSNLQTIDQLSLASEAYAYDIDYQVNEPIVKSNSSIDLNDTGLNSDTNLNDADSNVTDAIDDPEDSTEVKQSYMLEASTDNQIEAVAATIDHEPAVNTYFNEEIDAKTDVENDDLSSPTKNIESIGASLSFMPAIKNEADSDLIIEPEPKEMSLSYSDVHSEPATNAKSDIAAIESDSIDNEIATVDPRTLLRCPPQDLTGEWTAEKWDYWLQTAREKNSLAEDERALARQGMMTGLCNGESTFITNVDSKHLRTTFEQLSAKLQQQFIQADISLQIDKNVSENKDQTPEKRQKMRLEQATLVAQTLLLESPVMQYLSDRNEGKMGKVKLT